MENLQGSSERSIVVYSPRHRLIVSIILCVFIIAGLFYFINAIYSGIFPEVTFSVVVIVSLVELVAVLVGLILFVGAVIFNVHRLISREAVLIIDARGIIVRDYFPLGSIWLSWADVAVLYGRRPSYSYLYIRLKDPNKFLRKYHPVQRFIFRFNPAHPDAPITVSNAHLAVPVPQILGQVSNRFGNELHRYGILVQM